MPDTPAASAAGCPKCGRPQVTATYHPGLRMTPISERLHTYTGDWPCASLSRRSSIGEHLCRICERCGYAWCEATVEVSGD